MNMIRKKEASLLLVGDIVALFVALYLTLTLRYHALPSQELLFLHLVPFSFIFLASILVSFIAGLYEKHTLILKRKIPSILTQAQIANTLIAVAFFYFIPFFNITPKIILFLYLVLSLVFMVAWRMSIAESLGGRRKTRALLIGHGHEIKELHEEIQNNPRYGTTFFEWIDISTTELKGQSILELIRSKGISLVVADFSDRKVNDIMPVLYSCIFSGVQFSDAEKLYEEIFDRVPLSLVNDTWFLENVSGARKVSFDIFKRCMDILVSGITGIISLVFYPFVYIAMKIDDKGPLFSYQDRVGQNNKIVRILKFRTMSNPNGGGKWTSTDKQNIVTRVGNILRKTRIDELPQLWNVFKGDVSLIGPRPEFPAPVEAYAKEIPYYNVRHIVKPGLSGWAQIYGEHPHHGIDVDQTSNKLSHDLYYIKNRGITLDLKIALQTLKVLMSFVGR